MTGMEILPASPGLLVARADRTGTAATTPYRSRTTWRPIRAEGSNVAAQFPDKVEQCAGFSIGSGTARPEMS
jgi:hypothetical protein